MARSCLQIHIGMMEIGSGYAHQTRTLEMWNIMRIHHIIVLVELMLIIKRDILEYVQSLILTCQMSYLHLPLKVHHQIQK